MYEETPSRLGGAVLWHSVRPAGAPPTRVLPDGCMDLIWSSATGLLVAGPDATAQLVAGPAGERHVGLRLPPGTGPAVFGVPADELRDQRVPLAALWPDRTARAAADRVAEHLAAAHVAAEHLAAAEWMAAGGTAADRPGADRARPGRPAGRGAGAGLEAVVTARLRAAGGPDPAAAPLVHRLAAGRSVAAVAAEFGVGPRQLHRRSRALFGYGPKTLARILRLRRALDLAGTGLPLAEVAATTGYADQPHLSREVLQMAGVPLGVLTGGGGQRSGR